MVVFGLFEKLRFSNERSTKLESLYREYKYLQEENGKMIANQQGFLNFTMYMYVSNNNNNFIDPYT